MADEQAKVKQRREPSRLAWRWWIFWKGRSGWRTAWALILAIPPLLALIYLALPAGAQAPVVAALQAAGQALGATGLRVAAEVALVVCALASFALLFAPGYRSYPYLHLPTLVIPQVSVYLDAENIVSDEQIPAFLDHLRKALDGRRADLLLFVDVWSPDSRARFNHLSRYGFRPIHAAHNPTGVKRMWEAVDRELALHALERALVGPPQQEFIIVSNDGDYAPLIMRLIALGHSAQLWSTAGAAPYRELSEYLRVFPGKRFNLEDIEPVIGKAALAIVPAERRDIERGAHAVAQGGEVSKPKKQPVRGRLKKRKASASKWVLPAVQQPQSLTLEGERRLYYAIVESQDLRRQCEERLPSASDEERNTTFDSRLGDMLGKRLDSIGYTQVSRVEYWRAHLVAIGALDSASFPRQGAVVPEEAARQLFLLVVAAASAAARSIPNRLDGYLSTGIIRVTLADEKVPQDAQVALNALIGETNGQRTTHTRYLIYCARALGLVTFDVSPISPDLITRPRLTALAEQIIAQLAESQPDAPAGPEASV